MPTNIVRQSLVAVLETNLPLYTIIGNITFVITCTIMLIVEYSNFGSDVETFSHCDYCLQIIGTRRITTCPRDIIFK